MTPDAPKTDSRPTHIIMIGKSIRHVWVNMQLKCTEIKHIGFIM